MSNYINLDKSFISSIDGNYIDLDKIDFISDLKKTTNQLVPSDDYEWPACKLVLEDLKEPIYSFIIRSNGKEEVISSTDADKIHKDLLPTWLCERVSWEEE